jgi:hypothetical protein
MVGGATSEPTEGRSQASTRPGIYGFALVLEEADEPLGARMIPAAAGWPELRLRHTVEHVQLAAGEPSATAEGQLHMDDDRACAQLSEGGVGIMRRDTGEAWFRTPVALTVEELAHPLLSYATLAFAYWIGRESFHAGVFLSGGGAWALLGKRGAGKSSTLAWLARDGQRILADDLLVLDGQTAFAGPRMIDLTPASASHLGLTEDVEQVRHGYRQRMPLDPLAPEHQLRGWVSLEWGDEVRMTPVPAPERIPLLIEHGHQPRGVANWSNILALASLPTFELSRPHSLESLAPACELLLATIAAEGDSA